MRGKRWSDEKVTEALEALALSGNIRAAAREISVPESTVRRWKNNHKERLRAIKQRNEEIRNRIAEETVEEMAKRHAEAGKRLVAKGLGLLEGIRRTTAQGAARLVVAGIEIERLASGEVTQRSAVLLDFLELIRKEDEDK